MSDDASSDEQLSRPAQLSTPVEAAACDDGEKKGKFSNLWLVVGPSLAFAGVQISWAVQIGHGTSELRKLGISDRLVGLAWLAGPITGAVVQPLVGYLSDGCKSKFGKRRPFMLVGAFGIFFGLLLFSNAKNIGNAIKNDTGSSASSSPSALFIAIVAFWFLDAMTNTLQGPARALLGDVVDRDQQLFGNAFFSVANGLGKCTGYFLGSITTKIEVVYGAAAVISIILSLITILTIHEPDFEKSQSVSSVCVRSQSSTSECENRETVEVLEISSFYTNAPIMRAFIVQCFTCFAWMIFFVYASDWVGKEIFLGDANAPVNSASHKKFELGVMAANRGLLLMSILSIPLGIGLPVAIFFMGVQPIWSFSLFLLGAVLILCKFTASRSSVVAMFGLLSLPLAASFTIPWTIAGLSIQEHAAGSRGTQLALFNLSQSLPGIVAALLSGLVVRVSNGDLGYVMLVGGISAVLACAAVFFTIVPEDFLCRSSPPVAASNAGPGCQV